MPDEQSSPLTSIEKARSAKAAKREAAKAAQVAAQEQPAALSQEEIFARVQASVSAQREKEFVHGHRLDDDTIARKAAEIAKAPRRIAEEPVHEELPAIAAHRRAAQILGQEELAQRQALAERKGMPSTLRTRAPMRNAPRRNRPDPTRIPAHIPVKRTEDGRPWVTRYVRTTDNWGEPDPSLSRVQELKDVYDYEILVDQTGAPYRTRFGVAMQGHPDAYADRVVDYAPRGVGHLSDANAELLETAREAKCAVIGTGLQEDESVARR
jgi:hypothetical protein